MTALAQHVQRPTFNLQNHRTKYNILIQGKLEITYLSNVSPGANGLSEVPTESIYQQTKLASYFGFVDPPITGVQTISAFSKWKMRARARIIENTGVMGHILPSGYMGIWWATSANPTWSYHWDTHDKKELTLSELFPLRDRTWGAGEILSGSELVLFWQRTWEFGSQHPRWAAHNFP